MNLLDSDAVILDVLNRGRALVQEGACLLRLGQLDLESRFAATGRNAVLPTALKVSDANIG